MLPNPFAGTKFAAFGLPAPRGVRDPTAVCTLLDVTVPAGLYSLTGCLLRCCVTASLLCNSMSVCSHGTDEVWR